MELVPVGVFWIIALWALFQQKQVLMYLFFASMPFGSFAAIPTEMTGGLTLTPVTVVATLLIASQFCSTNGLRKAFDAALKPAELLLLFAFWLVAVVVTAFMPRFFAGEVEIVPVRFGESVDPAMLAPTPQNISQLVYISISVLTVFVFADMLRGEPMRRHALVALCLGAALTILTGFLDFASQYLPLQPLLDIFRTASYALVSNDEILDSKRVVGLMPEASVFGSLALSFLASLYFFRRALPGGRMRDHGIPILMSLLLLLVWLSTSSAAFFGLGLLGVAVVGEWCWRLASFDRNPYLSRGLKNEFWVGALAICICLLVVLAVPQLWLPIRNMFDVVILQKSSSSSYEERSMWTRVSWDALIATHGMGVGMGGTRASNFAVALASNAGVFGAAFYLLFVIQTMLLRRAAGGDAAGKAFFSAIRWSYLPPLFASLTIGTTPDFGVFNAFLYGFAVALSSPKQFQRGIRYVGMRKDPNLQRSDCSHLTTGRGLGAK